MASAALLSRDLCPTSLQMENRTNRRVRRPAGVLLSVLSAVQLVPFEPTVHRFRVGDITAAPGSGRPEMTAVTESSSPQADISTAAAHIVKITDAVSLDLTDSIPVTAAQRTQLLRLLQRYSDVFADNPDRTSTTHLTSHRIDKKRSGCRRQRAVRREEGGEMPPVQRSCDGRATRQRSLAEEEVEDERRSGARSVLWNAAPEGGGAQW